MEIENEVIDKIISKLNRNELDFVDLRKEMQSIKEIAIVGISKNIKNLKLIIGKFENDKDIARIACERKGEILKFFSDEIKDDLEIVQIAMKNNICAIEHASERIRSIEEIMKKAVLLEPKIIMYAGLNLKQNKEFMLLGLEKRHDLLQYMSEYAPNLNVDNEIILKTLKQSSKIITHLLVKHKKVCDSLCMEIHTLCEEIFLELKENIKEEDFPFLLEKYALIVYSGEVAKEKQEEKLVKEQMKKAKLEKKLQKQNELNSMQNISKSEKINSRKVVSISLM